MGLTWVNKGGGLNILPQVLEGLRWVPHGGYAKIVTHRSPSSTVSLGVERTSHCGYEKTVTPRSPSRTDQAG